MSEILPPELWENVFSHMSGWDLIRCSKVCTNWHIIIARICQLLCAKHITPVLRHELWEAANKERAKKTPMCCNSYIASVDSSQDGEAVVLDARRCNNGVNNPSNQESQISECDHVIEDNEMVEVESQSSSAENGYSSAGSEYDSDGSLYDITVWIRTYEMTLELKRLEFVKWFHLKSAERLHQTDGYVAVVDLKASQTSNVYFLTPIQTSKQLRRLRPKKSRCYKLYGVERDDDGPAEMNEFQCKEPIEIKETTSRKSSPSLQESQDAVTPFMEGCLAGGFQTTAEAEGSAVVQSPNVVDAIAVKGLLNKKESSHAGSIFRNQWKQKPRSKNTEYKIEIKGGLKKVEVLLDNTEGKVFAASIGDSMKLHLFLFGSRCKCKIETRPSEPRVDLSSEQQADTSTRNKGLRSSSHVQNITPMKFTTLIDGEDLTVHIEKFCCYSPSGTLVVMSEYTLMVYRCHLSVPDGKDPVLDVTTVGQMCYEEPMEDLFLWQNYITSITRSGHVLVHRLLNGETGDFREPGNERAGGTSESFGVELVGMSQMYKDLRYPNPMYHSRQLLMCSTFVTRDMLSLWHMERDLVYWLFGAMFLPPPLRLDAHCPGSLASNYLRETSRAREQLREQRSKGEQLASAVGSFPVGINVLLHKVYLGSNRYTVTAVHYERGLLFAGTSNGAVVVFPLELRDPFLEPDYLQSYASLENGPIVKAKIAKVSVRRIGVLFADDGFVYVFAQTACSSGPQPQRSSEARPASRSPLTVVVLHYGRGEV